jgi:D-3-phosphoglycerate dehydrogenase
MTADARPTVMVTESIDPAGIEYLRRFAQVVTPAAPDEAAIVDDAGCVDAMLVRVAPITARVIDAAPRLRHIQKHGVGVDAIDVAHATARGIPVSFTPEANATAVAEHAVTAALAAFKRLAIQDAIVSAGQWRPAMTLPVHELAGRTAGVVGGGRIGRKVVHALVHGFGMRGLIFDPFLTPADLADEGIELTATLTELLQQADLVSLHVPLTPATRHLIDADALSAMRPTAVLVNTCRGPVVDEDALARALESGQIAGAAIDVFAEEPPASSPLLHAPNVLLTPHFAGLTVESNRRMAVHAASEVRRVLAGEPPRWCINAAALEASV